MPEIHATIETPAGAVKATLGVPERMRLAHLAYAVLPIAEKLAALAARSTPVSCRPRCAGCCRQLVPVSPAEAWFLAELVQEDAVRVGFSEANDAYEASGLRERERAGEDLVDIALDWQRKAIPCPFLREELCSIYAHRPAACREYLVQTPKENCYQLGRAPITRVPLGAEVSDALGRVCMAKGLPARLPLPTALAWAAEHASEGARTFEGEALVREFLGQLH
ncbi:MAG: YkgJ family cysteine cluster protein [Polyangiales bacterium]